MRSENFFTMITSYNQSTLKSQNSRKEWRSRIGFHQPFSYGYAVKGNINETDRPSRSNISTRHAYDVGSPAVRACLAFVLQIMFNRVMHELAQAFTSHFCHCSH